MPHRDAADTTAALVAAQVQTYAPTWMVRWNRCRRRLEAWECSDPVRCRIVDGRSGVELWNKMAQTDMELWATQHRQGAA
ncbi:hypothetical protein FHR32_006315 [Streptosporangium album]|uniref:Uncharacterized protein n=1 Tax=Streptosporangium album TaxID=47479 RepID=A0A7W7S104_9ACTN|nr:hypothetical protein [Streptosporangium album]MBB4941929.1 hypothetical protein [Streptosporangium album]